MAATIQRELDVDVELIDRKVIGSDFSREFSTPLRNAPKGLFENGLRQMAHPKYLLSYGLQLLRHGRMRSMAQLNSSW